MKNKLSIVGMGFVGSALYNGFSPYFEIKMYDKFKKEYNELEETVNFSDFIFLCVPTPVNSNGEQDLSNIYDSIRSINKVIKKRKIIIIKSTILPGTIRKLSKEFKDSLDFVFNPEFLTERNALNDFLNQTRIVLGGDMKDSYSINMVEELYRIRFKATPIYKVKYEEAELVKYMCNCYFSTKVSFMNEIYDMCKLLNIDFETVRELFVGDMRITDSHTRVPGFDGDRGFGGKCVLPTAKLRILDLKEKNFLNINIEQLYNYFNESAYIIKCESCDLTFNNIEFKIIDKVTKRFIDEEIFEFLTNNGVFSCTKDHLIPILREEKIILIEAKDVLNTDSFIFKNNVLLPNISFSPFVTYKIKSILKRNYKGDVYNIELYSNSKDDDLYWIEQDTCVVSHNCFPKDLKSFIDWCGKNNLNCDIFKAADDVNERVRNNKDWFNIKGATSENNFE